MQLEQPICQVLLHSTYLMFSRTKTKAKEKKGIQIDKKKHTKL